MKKLALLLALILSSCSVPQAPPPALPSPQKVIAKPSIFVPRVIESPAHKAVLHTPKPIVAKPTLLPTKIDNNHSLPHHALQYREATSNGITFHIATFDSKEYHLAVADQNPGEKWISAKQANSALNGVAAINGGFFNTNGKPLGLVHASGESSGVWNTTSSLASGVYQYDGTPNLKRNRRADKSARELLQTGPFLVENGAIVSGLSNRRSAQRSVILWDGKNHWGIAMTSTCTLANLAPAIKALPSLFPNKTALNLDGGRSCDLFVSSSVKDGGIQKGHWLKSAVRNYLVVVKN